MKTITESSKLEDTMLWETAEELLKLPLCKKIYLALKFTRDTAYSTGYKHGGKDTPETHKTETGWLIELNDANMRNEHMLYWWDGQWTPDANQAIRFSRKEDGERMLKYLRGQGPSCSPNGTVTVTEHMFYSA